MAIVYLPIVSVFSLLSLHSLPNVPGWVSNHFKKKKKKKKKKKTFFKKFLREIIITI